MNNIYYTKESQFIDFTNRLKKDYTTFAPVKKEYPSKAADYNFERVLPTDTTPIIFNEYRTVQPLKAFFTHPSEVASQYFNPEDKAIDLGKTIIFGVKSCDIYGHRIQDFVFLEGVDVDQLYRVRRENIIFISSDCTGFKNVCHCLAWDVLPYPTEKFDLNLSVLNDGFLVEVGSPAGQQLIDANKDCFVKARDVQIAARAVKRENLIEKLRRHLLPQNLVSPDKVQQIVKAGYAAQTWKDFMQTCVECGGCNLICDTCHCFLLSDAKCGQQNQKVKVWDSCLYANYARVAGGANPLKTRAQRLRNRFMKKFDFFVDNMGIPACCGCGRCIEVCPGKIDIREVLKDLEAKTKDMANS